MTEFDELAVRRLMAGDTSVPLYMDVDSPTGMRKVTSPEVVEATRRMIRDGLTYEEMSKRLRGRMSASAISTMRKRKLSDMRRVAGIQPRGTVDYSKPDVVGVRRILDGCKHTPIMHSNKHTPEVVAAVRFLASCGFSDSQIAHVIVRLPTRGAVEKLRERHGIESGWTRRRPEDRTPAFIPTRSVYRETHARASA